MTATDTAAKQADAKGHAAHTKEADSQLGLPGKLQRPINLTFLGAGSVFCPTLCRDVLLIPGNDRGEIRLVDIDQDRLGTMHKVVERLIRELGKEAGWKVRSSTDRREVLPGTNYAVCCVEVSGVECVKHDNDIPLKYGIDQCIGDTIGPGGLFKSLRTIPVFLDILRDMRELCPGALMLNYTNPMSMMVLAAGRAVPEVPVVGLCHSVQGTSHLLAKYADVPYDEMRWECAGINHLAWFTKLEHKGRNLYEAVLYEKFARELKAGRAEAEQGKVRFDSEDTRGGKVNVEYEQGDLTRKDMCLHFGAFITESSGHLSEYLPYYRKHDEGRKLLRLGYEGGSRFYASNWPNWRSLADEQRMKLVSGEEDFELKRSWEYASWIIEAMEKDSPVRIHGNVMNHAAAPGKANAGEAGKLITNLPGDGAVEVACMIDGNGVNPTRYGALPAQMAHICASNMAMFDLGATACIERSKEAAVHSLLLDPLTAAVCCPHEIKQMTLEMFEAEKDFLPGYA
ncbi:alpha-glucosidase/alpha-galactosidase [Phycisphaerales bacterium AB-hyl4]|uniref:Alpha-glucosidase/alpha-galactosidase n=1 Tax=Natronomicrosphaera hydrolytica TaxID=3242702 RepID=A0ABV4U2L0_9BACT